MPKHDNYKLLSFFIYLYISISLLSVAQAEIVNIPDAGLRSFIENQLQKNPGEAITKAELSDESFTVLVATNKNVSDLTGLEHATSLEYIYLEMNAISDISALSSLTRLEHIHLEHNQITDISPLSNLTSLKSLNISYNSVTSLDSLPDLSEAYALFFQNNSISSIKPLIDATELTSIDNPDNIAVDLEGNPLDDNSVDDYIKILVYDRYISLRFTSTKASVVAGNNQSANTNTMLQPFVFQVVNHRNEILSNVDVSFTLKTGSGRFVNGANKNGMVIFETRTDSEGKASATFITGSTSGAHQITAHAKRRHTNYSEYSNSVKFTVTVRGSMPIIPTGDRSAQHQTQQQQEQTQRQEQTQQQEELKPIPEPNFTNVPFDYMKAGVGSVVFSEMMLSHSNQSPQWIEFYNTTDQNMDLLGWKIVGKYLDESDSINILESSVFSKSFVISGKKAVIVASFAASNAMDRISDGLADKTYILNANTENLWNYTGIVLELQNAEGVPIDRIGNLNVSDEIVWEIPDVVRNKRISLIRRLQSIRSQAYNFTFGMKAFGWFSADKVEKLNGYQVQHYYGSSTDIGTPGYRVEDGEALPVTLSSFRAERNDDGQIILRWTTESEIDNAGFHILRSPSKDGAYLRVNAKLIQGAGTTGQRNVYTWIDMTAKPQTAYYYQIVDVSFAGEHQTLTTTRLKGFVSGKDRFITRWGQLKLR